MAAKNQEQDVKKIIKPLRTYLNKELPIDKGLLTALEDNGLIASSSIKQWKKSFLDNGEKSEARCALIEYLEDNYTYKYLVRFTDLLSELSKDSAKPKLGEVAKKLNIAMGRDSSQQESQPPVARLQQQLKDEPQQEGGLIDSTTDLQSYVDPMLPYLEQLGTALGVSNYASAVNDGPQAKCIKILQNWLNCTPIPTWALLCEKLNKLPECNALVDKITRDRILHPLQDLPLKGEDDDRGKPGDYGDEETRKVIQDALENGAVQVNIVKCVLLGPPEAGKSQLKRALLGDFDPVHESTNASTQATPAVEIMVAGSNKWNLFDNSYLKEVIMKKRIQGKPSERNRTPSQDAAFLTDSSQPTVPPKLAEEEAFHLSLADFSELNEAVVKETANAIDISADSDSSDVKNFQLVYIVDTGGQPSFLDFHSVTATFAASYILVYDSSKGLEACPEMTFRKTALPVSKKPQHSIYSNFDLLHRSLFTVHHFQNQFSNRHDRIRKMLGKHFTPCESSRVLIVGTHHAEPGNDSSRLEALHQNIPSFKNRVSHHYVDSHKKEEYDKEYEKIRETLCEDKSKFLLPLSWFHLYLLSLHAGSKESLQVQTYDDLFKMCQHVEHVKSREEFRAMVTVMHSLGVFCCPDLDRELASHSLDNVLVFLDPTLLFDYVSRILAIPFLDLPQMKLTAPEVHALQELQDVGELTRKCLCALDIPDNLGSHPGFRDKLVEWLVTWGLAVQKGKLKEKWFIPSVLPLRPSLDSPVQSSGKWFGIPFYLTFIQTTERNYTFHFLPSGFFPAFVVLLLQNYQFTLPGNTKGSGNYQPRCRDSMMLIKQHKKGALKVHLVDEVDCLALYMSPANSALCSHEPTMVHAGTVLAELKECMDQTNQKLFSKSDSDDENVSLELCVACECNLSGDSRLPSCGQQTESLPEAHETTQHTDTVTGRAGMPTRKSQPKATRTQTSQPSMPATIHGKKVAQPNMQPGKISAKKRTQCMAKRPAATDNMLKSQKPRLTEMQSVFQYPEQNQFFHLCRLYCDRSSTRCWGQCLHVDRICDPWEKTINADSHKCIYHVLEGFFSSEHQLEGLIDSTTDLQSYVDPMLPYLEQLGTALGVSNYASAVNDGPQAKCIKILQTWLSRTPRPTWALLCEKLNKVPEFAALVDKIKRERNL